MNAKITLFVLLIFTAGESGAASFKKIQRGVHYATFALAKLPIPVADKKIHVVRINPSKVTFKIILASKKKPRSQPLAQCSKEHQLSVAINLGMYQTDHVTHVGYLRYKKKVNSSHWSKNYQSILAIGAKTKILDRDEIPKLSVLKPYTLVSQNLRLIKGPRKNVWSKQAKRWSEAAVGIDSAGNLLFIFCRAPFSMWEFNKIILALPIDLQKAMHMEGGPEASLSIHGGGINLDLCGSFETSFLPDDSNHVQWPIPNVLGIRRK